MARRIAFLIGLAALAAGAAGLSHGTAMAADFDQKGEAQAKEATRLFHRGMYEAASAIYARLAVDYPAMVIFYRNLGACYYYLNKPEPALSNLRQYLTRRSNISPEDKAAVERWIDEMERLRAGKRSSSAALEAGSDRLAEAAASDHARAVRLTTPSSGPSAETQRPLYKRWWLWTGAAVVIAGTGTAVLLLSNHSDGPCAGKGNACIGVP
jgi:hypothetical protein